MPNIIAQPLQWPFSCSPSNFQGILDAVAQYIQWQIPSYIQQFISGPTKPTADQNTMVWLKLDSIGRPIGFYYNYGGYWRPVYTGRNFQIVYYGGNPTVDFDPTGLGIVGSVWDGWALCNGNNGTPDLRNTFIVSGDWNTLIQQWAITIDPASNGNPSPSGGNPSFTILPGNLPLLQAGGTQLSFSATTVATGNAGTLVIFPLDNSATSGYLPNLVVTSPEGKLGASTPIPLLPPYYVVGAVMFVGY